MKVYLDYAATTPILPVVQKAMLETMECLANGELGNASALHSAGQSSREAIERARTQVAKLINASPEEIIFTSGGSEANNTVAEIFRGRNVAFSAIEHPSLRDSLRARANKAAELPVDRYGFLEPDAEFSADTDLVSIMLANNELGTLEPVSELVKCCKDYNTPVMAKGSQLQQLKRTYFHSDATQALGKVEIDVESLGVDYLTISAHKIGGPVGVGALYVRKGAPIRSLILGGHQERQHRAGTSNVLAITGFGVAADWCQRSGSVQRFSKIAKLRDYLAKRILDEVPYSSLNSPLHNSLPNIVNVSFAAAEGESIQLYLDLEGIAVSTGSACAAGDLQPSAVLMATRKDAEAAHSSIRFSLGLNTTKDEIDYTMSVLPEIVRRLQGISTIKIQENYAK